MRILHCIATLGGGGSELQLSQLALAQARSGFDVHLAVREEGPRAEGLRSAGISLHRLQRLDNHSPMLYWSLARLVARVRPQIIQTWLPQMDILGGLAARRVGIPWVLTERSSGDCFPPGWKYGTRAYLARSARAIVSNSCGGKAYWTARLGPHVRQSVIPNAVSVQEIRSTTPVADEAIALPAGHRMVLAVGRLNPEKNLANLIRAIEKLPSSIPATLYLCGVGPDEESLRQLASRLALEQRVRFCGFVSPVWSWMRRADAYVSVSLFEGQPNAVLEAMAAKCPMILSDIAAHRELLDDRGALFVDPRSPARIADALSRCLANRGESTNRAAVAEQRVADHSAEQIAEEYRSLYEEVLRGDAVATPPREPACAE